MRELYIKIREVVSMLMAVLLAWVCITHIYKIKGCSNIISHTENI